MTGLEQTDTWFNNNVMDEGVREKFMNLPLWRRKTVVLKMMDKPPQHPESWILGCVRNHNTNELERRIVGTASPHNQWPPPVRMEGPPIPPRVSPDSGFASGATAMNGGIGGAMSSASLSPGGQSGAGVISEPSWSQTLLSLWPTKKSHFMAEFMSLMDPKTQAALQELPVQTLTAMGFTLAVAGTSSTTASVQVQQWLGRLQPATGTASSRSPSVGESLGGDSDPLQIQMVLAAPTYMVAATLLKTYLAAYEQLTSQPVMFMPLIVLGTASEQSDVKIEDLAGRLRLTVNMSVTSLAHLERFVADNATQFQVHNVKTVFITMISAAALDASRTTNCATQSVAPLHAEPFHHMWAMLKCSASLRSAVGDSSVAELVFAPAGLTTEAQTMLEKLVGSSASVELSTYYKVARRPAVFACPRGLSIVKCCQSQDSGNRILGEWSMTADPELPIAVSGGLVTHLTRLMEIVVFQERSLNEAEEKTLAAFAVSHATTGERRYCSRDWWFRWWGLAKSPLKKHVDDTLPCLGNIMSVTGVACAAESPMSRPCGRDRYCRSCETALTMLESVYCLPNMVDCMLALTTKAVQLWREPTATPEPWQRCSDVDRAHVCKAGCAGV